MELRLEQLKFPSTRTSWVRATHKNREDLMKPCNTVPGIKSAWLLRHPGLPWFARRHGQRIDRMWGKTCCVWVQGSTDRDAIRFINVERWQTGEWSHLLCHSESGR